MSTALKYSHCPTAATYKPNLKLYFVLLACPLNLLRTAANCQGSSPGCGELRVFLFSLKSTLTVRSNQAPTQRYQDSFSGVKRPGREVYHSPPSAAEVKKEWSYNSTFPTCLHIVNSDNSILYYCNSRKYQAVNIHVAAACTAVWTADTQYGQYTGCFTTCGHYCRR